MEDTTTRIKDLHCNTIIFHISHQLQVNFAKEIVLIRINTIALINPSMKLVNVVIKVLIMVQFVIHQTSFVVIKLIAGHLHILDMRRVHQCQVYVVVRSEDLDMVILKILLQL